MSRDLFVACFVACLMAFTVVAVVGYQVARVVFKHRIKQVIDLAVASKGVRSADSEIEEVPCACEGCDQVLLMPRSFDSANAGGYALQFNWSVNHLNEDGQEFRCPRCTMGIHGHPSPTAGGTG